MKTLGKIKLNQFYKEELDQRKLNALKGGCSCKTKCNCWGYVTEIYNAADEASDRKDAAAY